MAGKLLALWVLWGMISPQALAVKLDVWPIKAVPRAGKRCGGKNLREGSNVGAQTVSAGFACKVGKRCGWSCGHLERGAEASKRKSLAGICQ
jgi:hypothetical protein